MNPGSAIHSSRADIKHARWVAVHTSRSALTIPSALHCLSFWRWDDGRCVSDEDSLVATCQEVAVTSSEPTSPRSTR